MHELSIALSIVDGVLDEAENRGMPRVEAVHLRVGRLSGVDREALVFSYRVAAEDTPLAGSRLVIEDIEVVIHCPACGGPRPARAFPLMLCTECGSAGERVLQGDELEVSGLEVAA